MSTMKAFVRTSSKDHKMELKEVPVPAISDEEVLIKVEAFGVGIHDRYFIPQQIQFPYPVGSEGSGIIMEKGRNTDHLQIGDRVIFSSSMQTKGGSWAEYAAVPNHKVIPMLDELSFTIGAALPVAGKTALESMHALALERNDTLFIAGASAAIGSIMIQLAKNKGIHVIASASEKNHDFMKSLGAEATVDYRDPAWKNKVMEYFPDGVDAALAIQPGTAKDSMDIVRKNCTLVTVSGDSVTPKRNITVKQIMHQLNLIDSINDLMQDIAANKLNIIIEKVYPFKDAIKALEKTETRHARGKLVVTVNK